MSMGNKFNVLNAMTKEDFNIKIFTKMQKGGDEALAEK